MLKKKGAFLKTIAAVLLSFSLVFSNVRIPLLNQNTLVNAETVKPYTWNNIIPVKSPAKGQKNNGKVVLFDNTHDNCASSADWVIDGGFSDFADALVKEGYTVKEYRGVDKNHDGAIRFYDDRNLPKSEEGTSADKNEAVITYDGIKNADVFVTAESNRPMRESEEDALKRFVADGKGVYFIADHYDSDRNCNTWDSTEVYDGYNRCDNSSYNMGGVYGDVRNPKDAAKGWLSETFGLRYRFNAVDSDPSYKPSTGASDVRPASETDGITNGVSKEITMDAGSTIAITDPNKAKGIVYFKDSDKLQAWHSGVENSHGGSSMYFGGHKEGAVAAISKPDKGRAAFLSDSSPVEDSTAKYRSSYSGKIKSNYDGWNEVGNAAQLSVNIVNWLADSSENYTGFGSTNHPKDEYGETYDPMADVEKSDPNNGQPWSTNKPSFDPWNTDTWAEGSYGAPYPVSTVSSVKPDITKSIAFYPKYLYSNEPYAVILGAGAKNPSYGAFLINGGAQAGQVYDKATNSWKPDSPMYYKVNGTAPLAITARVNNLASSIDISKENIKIRTKDSSGKNVETDSVTGFVSGYGYIEGKVDADEGDVVAAISDGAVIGTAQVDKDKNVKVACKSGSGITLSIFSPDGKDKNYTSSSYSVNDGKVTEITVPKSSNADLSSLKLTDDGNEVSLSPMFNSSVTSYNASVENNTTAVKVVPVSADSKASINVNGKQPDNSGNALVDNLSVGNNNVNITVTAEDGTVKTYTIVLNRQKAQVQPEPTNPTDSDKAVKIINTTSDGNTAVADMSNSHIANASVFSALKGTNKSVELQNGMVSWTFNGKDIVNDPKDIDLSVELINKDNVSDSSDRDLLQRVNDANPILIKFADNGVLPGKALIKLNLGKDNANKKGMFLYYYNPVTNSFEKIADSLTANQDGIVEFTIAHCSEYVLTLKDLSASNNISPTGTQTNTASAKKVLPQTGSFIDTNVLEIGGLMLVIAGGAIAFRKRKVSEK